MVPRKILIATGVFPPDVGGPAKYASNLSRVFQERGFDVAVVSYGKSERMLPFGLRHVFFFLRLCKALRGTSYILALDTVSVGLSAFWAAAISNTPFIVRIGGDFLWESYVERTRQKILLSQFYGADRHFSVKEKIIFSLSAHMMRHADALVFPTPWLRDIFQGPYRLSPNRMFVVENFVGDRRVEEERAEEPRTKTFVSSSRPIFLKNQEMLTRVFDELKKENSRLELISKPLPPSDFAKVLVGSHAVIVPSLSEVSPNLVLEALALKKPVIVTEDCGILDRVSGVVLTVDPLNSESLKEAIKALSDEGFYKKQKEKVEKWDYVHSWENIGREFLEIFSSLSPQSEH